MSNQVSIDVCGDRLAVTWDGNVWVSSVGTQYADVRTALADELRDYLRASGEDADHVDGQYIADHYEVQEGGVE